MQPENSPENSFFHCLPAGNGFMYGFPAMESYCSSSFYPVESPADQFMHAPEARALTASENHKEAERKRRERINSHLNRLRTLLLCNSKTDKASLLAKVVQRVRELKQQTSEIMQFDQSFPAETDEITVLQNEDSADGKSLIKASLCCEDRINLLPDLIEILKSLPLSPLRSEIVTLGGRIRNVIVLAGEKDQTDESVVVLRDALKSIIRGSSLGAGESSKRRRVFSQRIIS